MASLATLLCVLLFFVSSLVVQGTFDKVFCEKLPLHVCAFAVSSKGSRCVLETDVCKTSEIVSNRFSGYIETDNCVKECGIDRLASGMSTETLLSPDFMECLCKPVCYKNCANIADYFSTLGAAEGVSLSGLCEKHNANAPAAGGERRGTLESAPASAPSSDPATFI